MGARNLVLGNPSRTIARRRFLEGAVLADAPKCTKMAVFGCGSGRVTPGHPAPIGWTNAPVLERASVSLT
ncbi:MAG TPA: hypothetical protein VFO40_17535, partial [Chthoniobacterales bacterium]|nr:hypothetical protein [Chthoniobacterales bacterium]